jgi:hypothetical protein
LIKPGGTTYLTIDILRSDDGAKNKIRKARKASKRIFNAKLQKPYPEPNEFTAASNLALLRHYPHTGKSTNEEDSFIKPTIQKSTRVENLLKNCPIAPEPTPSGTGSTLFGFNLRRPNASGAKKLIEVNRNLALNKSITVTKKAKQKAWECFAIEEPGRANRGREYVESGLNTADFDAEDEGRPNDLPPWKKWKTNKLATAETLE